MRWSTQHQAAMTNALAQTRSGQPVALLVTGEPGMGKSAALEEVVARADGFSVLRADCLPSAAPTPFDVVDQLGVGVDTLVAAASSTLAAQSVRAHLDSLLPKGPALIVIDDVQWADEDSVSALVEVMRRAVAEPILLCLATRPLETSQHPVLQRWASRSDRVRRLDLAGLDADAALALLRQVSPDLPEDVGISLCEHAGGNPLYLQALATEYAPDEFIRMNVLPAPAQFAASVTARLERVSAPARGLAFAVAVLSDSWCSLRDAAAIGDVIDAARAADELVTHRLALVREADGGMQLRIQHSLARSAIYQAISLETRRDLHARASTTVNGVGAIFEHRLAAADGYDQALANDLAAYAELLRARRGFAQAARYECLASTVSPDPAARERRWLDSLFDSLMAMNRADVRSAMSALTDANDARRRDLVLGVLAAWERRPHDAVRLLAPWSGETGSRDVVQYRIETMLAWALLMTDADESDIQTALSRGRALDVADGVVARFAMLVGAQLLARHIVDLADLPVGQGLPDDPRQAPLQATGALSWRGAVHANAGHFDRATADLNEVTERMQHGQAEFSSGSWHAILARAQWFAGDWARARVNFRTAAALCADYPHALVVTALPLRAIGEGALDEADTQLEHADEVLHQVPWREAGDQLSVTKIIRAHAGQQPRAAMFAALRPDVADVEAGRLTKNVIWLTHVALAAVWAKEYPAVTALTDQMEGVPGRAPWTSGLAEWIRGLAAESTGDGKAALRHLTIATQGDLVTMPLYRAHVHADHARVAHLVQGAAAAHRSLGVALEIYKSLGAQTYLARVQALRQTPDDKTASSTRDPQIQLSDRERDVLTLVVAGLSYAQVARDLFITQSTVSYHLGNIYAKTNVKSRHQLTQLARSAPSTLGLPELVTSGA